MWQPQWVLCRIDFSPCEQAFERASWLKRMSLSEMDATRRKEQGGKQKGGNRARIQETKPVIETKAFGDAGKEHQLLQKLFQERDLQWFNKDSQWGEIQNHVYQKGPIWVTWFLSAMLFNLIWEFFLPLPIVGFCFNIEKSRGTWLGLWHWTSGNYLSIIPLRGADVSINYKSWAWVVYSTIKPLLWMYNLTATTY